MSTLQNYYYLKLDFRKVDQHKGGKRLIHSIKHRKDNQLQSLQLPVRKSKYDRKNSEGDLFNGKFKENVQGHNIQGGA